MNDSDIFIESAFPSLKKENQLLSNKKSLNHFWSVGVKTMNNCDILIESTFSLLKKENQLLSSIRSIRAHVSNLLNG